MNMADKISVALLVGLLAAASTSLASAQESPARDAVMAKCIKQAQSQYPDDTTDNQNSRTALYKVCMTAAGQRP